MEARPDNIAGVVASEFQVSGLFMFDQLSGSVSDLWNFVLHRLRDSASIGSLQLASAQQLDDMCKNVEARTALLFGLLSFLFVSLFLCGFFSIGFLVCLFVCFSLVTHVTSAGHIRSACHGTSPRHIMASCHVMMSGANLSNRVHSAAQWAASAHTLPMSKPVITPVLKALRNGLLRRIYFTHAQTCDNVRGQGATRWTASAHTLHIPKPVITFMVKVLRNGLTASSSMKPAAVFL